MTDCNGMTESLFRQLAITSIVKYWNTNAKLVSQFGQIKPTDVYITWQCKAIENFKALLGVSKNGDGMYFEFTLHANKNRCYLDVYHKETQVVVPLDRDV